MEEKKTNNQKEQKTWIEKLYFSKKTNKFAQHLIKSFCNKYYTKREKNIEDIISHETVTEGISSKLSDKKLSIPHYNELIAFVESQLRKDDKTMQLMVEYIKADILLEKIIEKYPDYSTKNTYNELPTKMKAFIALICRLPKSSIYDGKAEDAWNILSGRKKLYMIPKIKIDTLLMINKMVKEKTSHASMSSMVDNSIIEKLKKAVN